MHLNLNKLELNRGGCNGNTLQQDICSWASASLLANLSSPHLDHCWEKDRGRIRLTFSIHDKRITRECELNHRRMLDESTTSDQSKYNHVENILISHLLKVTMEPFCVFSN